MHKRFPAVRIAITLTSLMIVTATVSHAEVTPMWTPSPLEAAQINGIKSGIEQGIRAHFAATGKAVRDAHAKQHGCVRAEFKVVEGLAEKNLNVGVFSLPGHAYEAITRYSNGSGDPQGDDRPAGGRGMAIKVLGVAPQVPHMLDDETSTQDFQMINYPVFFVKSVADYIAFMTDAQKFFSAPDHAEEAAVMMAMNNPKVNPTINPLESTYFSMTPRQFGPTDTMSPIKFSATPTPCEGKTTLAAPTPLRDDPNALRLAMRDTLMQDAACFDFQIQRQVGGEAEMPVNNPVKVWDTNKSKFVTVAKITIPKQRFYNESENNLDKDAREVACEDLAISPWHSLPEHQPLGAIEAARKVVYQATSKLRHELNQRPTKVPAYSNFKDPIDPAL